MTAEGNGVHYKLIISGKVAADIEALGEYAAQVGKFGEFRAAVQLIRRRLRADPFGFGELVRHHRNIKLLEHARFVGPLIIRFGIHEEKPIVFLVSVTWNNP